MFKDEQLLETGSGGKLEERKLQIYCYFYDYLLGGF